MIDIIRLLALGLLVSAPMMAWFKAGTRALDPLGGYKLWPTENRWQFIVGGVLLLIIELMNWIIV